MISNTLPSLTCSQLINSHCIISLLNVRSIMGKLLDIQNDSNLCNAHIYCFCETWLTPSQELPQLFDNHIVFRCDRNIENTHGGVLISIPDYMSPTNVVTINRANIEILMTTVTISPMYIVQIAVIYKSPNVSLQCLNNALIEMFNNVDSNLPRIIMGDFNKDIINNEASQLLDIMSLKVVFKQKQIHFTLSFSWY